MKQVLESQSALLEAILDTSIAAVCVLDPAGNIVFANRQARRTLGLRPSQIVGRAYNAPEWRSTDLDGGPWPDENQPFSIVMRTGESVTDVRHAIEWPDGQRKLLSINGAPIKDESGQISRLVFSVTDITEQVSMEQRVGENATWLRLALASAQMGTWSWDLADGGVRWSDETLQLFGLEPGEFGGTYLDYLSRVHAEDRPMIEDTISSTFESGVDAYKIEHRIVLPNGEVRWLEGRGRVSRDERGEPCRIAGTVMDITARKASDRALRNSEQAFRSVVETIPDFVASIDRDRTIRFLNRSQDDRGPERILGRSAVEFLVPESRAPYLLAQDRAFATGELQELEVVAFGSDGEPVPFLVRMRPVLSGGEVESLTTVGTDISQLKEAERALRDSQVQLLRAQRLEAVGRLAGGVAHDFNNLLTAILGCAELSQSRLADRPDELDLVDQIREAAERGAALTRQLLTFASRQVVQPRVIDPNELVVQASGLLRRVIGEDIELATELAAGIWPVEVDPGQFEQILVNLAVNARDAMPEGGRLILGSANLNGDASAPDERDRRDRVVVTVLDTGVGMDAETAQLVFEPFFTTKEPGKGTGLGLSTCFGIVRQAGGRLEVDSSVGQGTRFRIVLPRSRGLVLPEGSPRTSDGIQRGVETILLVEDDSMVRKVTRTMLERAGYEVIEAVDGEDALRRFEARAEEIDLLISDVVMPGKGGAELAGEIRERRPDLCILMMSGYSPDLGPMGELVEAGVEVVQKPFRASTLSRKVRELLDRRPR